MRQVREEPAMTTPDAGNHSSFSARCRQAATAMVAAAGLLLAAGCGSDIDKQPQTARPTEDTQKDFGDLEVHYNAIRTDQLTPEVARAYGIERSPNRVLLNVAMLTKTPGGAAKPVDGTVSASAHNLNGQLKSLRDATRAGRTGRVFHRRGRHQRRRDPRVQHRRRARPPAADGARCSSSANSSATDSPRVLKKSVKNGFDVLTTLVFMVFFAC